MSDNRQLHLRVRTVCCVHGVPVISLQSYWNFAQQVDKGKRNLRGKDLDDYAGVLVERYVKLGLDRRVLASIRYNVFSIGVPGRPCRKRPSD
jgi:hypothetical protein